MVILSMGPLVTACCLVMGHKGPLTTLLFYLQCCVLQLLDYYQLSLGYHRLVNFYKLLQSLNVLIVYFWKITDLSRICDLLISDSSLTVLKSNILTLNHSFLHFPCSSRQMLIFH